MKIEKEWLIYKDPNVNSEKKRYINVNDKLIIFINNTYNYNEILWLVILYLHKFILWQAITNNTL